VKAVDVAFQLNLKIAGAVASYVLE
jgi:hypothetical protein